MILLSDLWYFYDTSCKIIQNVSFFYLIIYQLFISTFSQRMILWYFFHKKLFTYEHMLNGKSKKYLIWNLIDTKNTSRYKLYHTKKNNPIFSAYFFNKLAPQPHQGILRVRLYAVGQGDVLGEEENLWHEEVVGVPFRHFLHALPRHGEKYLGT